LLSPLDGFGDPARMTSMRTVRVAVFFTTPATRLDFRHFEAHLSLDREAILFAGFLT
jgi:hypothetical protein